MCNGKLKMFALIIFFLVLSIISLLYLFETEDDYEIEYKPCVDKYGNEFIDEVCQDKIYDNLHTSTMILSAASMMIVFFLVIVFVTMVIDDE